MRHGARDPTFANRGLILCVSGRAAKRETRRAREQTKPRPRGSECSAPLNGVPLGRTGPPKVMKVVRKPRPRPAPVGLPRIRNWYRAANISKQPPDFQTGGQHRTRIPDVQQGHTHGALSRQTKRMRRRLLAAQRFHGIHSSGAASRRQARQDGSQHQHLRLPPSQKGCSH
jgi:hypothetical protein